MTRLRKPKRQKKGRGYAHKFKVLTLVERGGRTRSMVVCDLKAKTLAPTLRDQVAKEARIMTDGAGQCTHVRKDFAERHVARHGTGEYGRGEIHTNTIEGYFSVFKRGMKGIFQHCRKGRLHRYLAERDFRYDNGAALRATDPGRVENMLAGILGTRLYYRGSSAGYNFPVNRRETLWQSPKMSILT